MTEKEKKELEELKELLKNSKAERNYNFLRPVGQFIEHVDTVNFSMDKDGNFHFENVGQVNGEQPNQLQETTDTKEESMKESCRNTGSAEGLFKFTHPAISGEEERKVHEEIQKLVSSQGIQEICKYLNKMESEEKIFMPQSADSAYSELVRMGMPSGGGFNIKTFTKYYKK